MKQHMNEYSLARQAAKALMEAASENWIRENPKKVERDPATGKLNFIDLSLQEKWQRLETVFTKKINTGLINREYFYFTRSSGHSNRELRNFLASANLSDSYLPTSMTLAIQGTSVTIRADDQDLLLIHQD